MHWNEIIQKRIEEYQNKIIEIGDHIWHHAEMGFKEWDTAALAAQIFQECGLKHIKTGLAVTGVKGYLKDPVPGELCIAIIGELDALPMDQHTDANPKTGAAHCCGHNAQMAAMLGSVYALTDPEIRDHIEGNIAFMAVPAEEFVDISFKTKLIEDGIIEFGGGKCELIRIGAFDDICIALGHHILPNTGITLANGTTNGFVNKVVSFTGKASHAADAPHLGVDALNAAMLALHAVDAQRETLKDQDNVRIHSFLPKAGEAMNVVAENTSIESSVRANKISAVSDAASKYDRAMKAGAMALGCQVTIDTMPGYLPTVPVRDPSIVTEILERHASDKYLMAYRNCDFHENGSTDFGDLSQILPVLQFRTGGYAGTLHNISMRVTDPYLAYVLPAQIFAELACELLEGGGIKAKKILVENPPQLSKEAYIAYMRSTRKKETYQSVVTE